MEKILHMQMLENILFDTACSLDGLIEDVLNDSEDAPECSVVSVNNLILSYIQISNDIGKNLPYKNTEEYFDFEGYPKEEYLLFEKKRKIESEYFIGEQFKEQDLQLN